ncbi:hypothetical protein AAY473_006413 [Plecturocebus cupreus]
MQPRKQFCLKYQDDSIGGMEEDLLALRDSGVQSATFQMLGGLWWMAVSHGLNFYADFRELNCVPLTHFPKLV